MMVLFQQQQHFIPSAASLLVIVWRISLYTSCIVGVCICVVVIYHRYHAHQRRRQQQHSPVKVLGFFHPYCSSGGGGERVLWKMIQVIGALYDNDPSRTTTVPPHIVIYTIDPPTPTYTSDILQHVQDRFALSISTKLKLSFVHLHTHKYLLQSSNSFSLLMESIGAMRLAYRALNQNMKTTITTTSTKISASSASSPTAATTTTTAVPVLPDVFIDTTGYAFTYLPAVLLFGCRVLAYVHYPTISTDMLQLVWERRRSSYNHSSYIASSMIISYIKLLYYIWFAILYGTVGSLASLVLVNSTWTYNHIASLWLGASYRKKIRIVYPPCSLAQEQQQDNSKKKGTVQQHQREAVIVSIGQFRPEKDHVLQIESMYQLLQRHPELKTTTIPKNSNNNNNSGMVVQMILIGSCRGPSDEQRLQQLQQLCEKLDITSHVQFIVNQPFPIVLEWLAKASIGIHTMWNEHFGIGIVEMMAAGLIVIAHNSGGPKSDIVVPLVPKRMMVDAVGGASATTTTRTGYLASTAEEYAECMYQALTMDNVQANAIRVNAQESALRFTDDVFAESFEKALLELKLL